MRLVLFDCDGTLVDSASLIVASAHSALAELGLDAPPEPEIRATFGLSPIEAVRTWRPDLPEIEHFRLARAFGQHYLRLRALKEHKEPLFPGMQDLLDQLRDEPDTQLGIVTGNGRRGLADILAQHGLTDRFATLQTADTHPSKPDPSMILTAMAETGIGPADTVVIGDTDFDIRMGHAAGVRPIAVAWGNHPVERLLAAKPAALAHDVAELRDLLERR